MTNADLLQRTLAHIEAHPDFQGSHGRSVAAFAWDELAVADAARGAAS